MSNSDVIKEYLVSLGFKVDNKTFKAATGSIDNLGKTISKFAGTAVGEFAVASTAVATFFVAANVGIAKFLDGLGKAQIENEIFARQMWTTEANAMALNNTLKAMGVTMQDLYLSPTLMEQFKVLRQQSYDLQAPSEYKDQMKFIQSISFEFTRMKLEASYAMQWIGYYFIKYMGGPLKDIKITLDDINDRITKSMPQWTKVIAQVMSWFARMGLTGVDAIKSLIKVFKSIPTELKIAGGAFAGFLTLLDMGPVGLMIAGILALLLLLDDYNTYKSGGKSALADMWKDVDKFKQTLVDNGTISTFKDLIADLAKTLDDLGTDVVDLLKNTKDLLDTLSKLAGFKDFNDFLATTFTNTLITIDKLVQSISDGLKVIDGFANGNAQGAIDKVLQDGKEKNAIDKKKGGFWGFNASLSDGIGNIYSQFNHLFDKKSPSKNSNDSWWDILTNPKKWAISGTSYVYPSSSGSKNTDVKLSQTNHIYGTDPNSTANAVVDKTGDMLQRNFRSVI